MRLFIKVALTVSVILAGLVAGAIGVGAAVHEAFILYHRAPRQIVLYDMQRDVQLQLLNNVERYDVDPKRRYMIYAIPQENNPDHPRFNQQRCAWMDIKSSEERAEHWGEQCFVHVSPHGTQSLFVTQVGQVWTFYLHDADGVLEREWKVTQPGVTEVTTWSPNGSFIVTAFEVDTRHNGWTLYHANLITGEAAQLLEDANILSGQWDNRAASWSPYGNYLIIHVAPGNSLNTVQRMVVDAHGNMRDITLSTDPFFPHWLSDNVRIIQQEQQAETGRLVLTNVSDNSHQPMTDFADEWTVYQISSDEQFWLLRRYLKNQQYDLVLLNTNTLEQTIVAQSPGTLFATLLRDGQYVGYWTDTEAGLYRVATSAIQRFDVFDGPGSSFIESPNAAVPYAMQFDLAIGGGWRLRLFNLDTNDITTFEGDTDLVTGRWLPDGRHILLQNFARNNAADFLLSTDTMTLHRIDSVYDFATPDWSADRSQVIFGVGDGFDTQQIFLMDIEAATVQQLTDARVAESAPLWIR